MSPDDALDLLRRHAMHWYVAHHQDPDPLHQAVNVLEHEIAVLRQQVVWTNRLRLQHEQRKGRMGE